MPSRKAKPVAESHEGDQSPILPMEARLVDSLPEDDGWQFEPKWDGFRCLAFRAGDDAALYAKSGKPLGRYFPEVVAAIQALPGDRFVLDGELAIPFNATISFDALQLRLHPAESRIRKLSAETPAIFILFDMLAAGTDDMLMQCPFSDRRDKLETFVRECDDKRTIRLSPFTRDPETAQTWLDTVGGALDGVVAKRLDGPYEPGERAMLKIKRLRSADCVVGGFRYGTGSKLVGSLLLGLYDDDGKLNHVGFTTTIANSERAELTARLEALRGEPGFSGRAPGGPSRWATERSGEWESLRSELVVEVQYDHASGDRMRHGAKLLRWRPDKAPFQCTMEQLELAASPSVLVRELVRVD